MSSACTLDDVALGDLSPKRARAAIAEALADASTASVGRVYAALRTWVWKAINARRRDQELRDWFDILSRTSAFLEPDFPAVAARLGALHELIHESIAVAETLPVASLLRRSHVRDVLVLVAEAPGGRLDRADVGRSLGLKQANLTRVLTLACTSGLLERHVDGKAASYQLTRAGQDAAVAVSAEAGRPRAGSVPDGAEVLALGGSGYFVVRAPSGPVPPAKQAKRGQSPSHGDRRALRHHFPEVPPSLLDASIVRMPLAAQDLATLDLTRLKAFAVGQASHHKPKGAPTRLPERRRPWAGKGEGAN